jgi:hypothetical protein
MESKVCGSCKVEKPLKDFNKNKSKKDGLNTMCRECSLINSRRYYAENKEEHKLKVRARNREYYAENRKLLFEYYKQNPCVDCGNDNPIVLELDHKDDCNKHKDVSKMMSYKWETIEKEINKCDVRCANCHRIRTAKQLGWYKGLIT